MIPVRTFAGRRVAVFGLARTGQTVARALQAGGADVAAWDDGERSRESARVEGLPLLDLAAADWSGFAALVLAPGVPLTHPSPHWTVERARAAGVEVIGDTELFLRERRDSGAAAKVIGITGTNGKSTTTALTAHLLRSAGLRVAMGGNIGDAVLGLQPFRQTDAYVIELSSYQIDLTPTLQLDAGIMLNLSPDHLDRHGDMAHYAAVKERILAATSATGVAGLDDPWSRAMALRRALQGLTTIGIEVLDDPTKRESANAAAERESFQRAGGAIWRTRASGAIVTLSGAIVTPSGALANLAGIATLRGAHNAQNAAAALAASIALGADPDRLTLALSTYPGLAHRMEIAGRRGRVLFVNDSKATNADSTGKALSSYDDAIYWIAGGLPKEGGIAPLAPYFNRVAKAYLIGEAAADFAATLAGKVEATVCGTLDAAVAAAARDATASKAAEPVVLLSPACASFDQFADFEDRGNRFRSLVASLPADNSEASR